MTQQTDGEGCNLTSGCDLLVSRKNTPTPALLVQTSRLNMTHHQCLTERHPHRVQALCVRNNQNAIPPETNKEGEKATCDEDSQDASF